MARTQAPDTTSAHLRQLAAALRQREWTAQLDDTRPVLRVVNPETPAVNAVVHCGGWQFLWSWRERIGSVDDVDAVADRIIHVLRGAGT